MRRKQTEVLLTTVGVSLLLVLALLLPLRTAAAPPGLPLLQDATPTGETPITPTEQITTPTPTLTPTSTPEPPTSTPDPPTATSTLTPTTPTPSPTPTATPAPPPTLAPTLTPPQPSPTPTAIPGWSLARVLEEPVLLAGVLVGLLGLFFLVLLAVLLRGRKRRQRPRTGTRPIKPLKPAAAPSAPVVAKLICADAEGKPQVFVLPPEGVTIGRAEDNTLVIGPTISGWESVSHHHARILRKGEDWIVTDLNSRNGIYVNDRRTGRNLLRDGWKLCIGGVSFTFRAGKGA